MTHFASLEMLGGAERCCHEVRFETRRYVNMRLRPGLYPGPLRLSLQRSPKPSSWIWGGEYGRGNRKAKEGKGTEEA